MPTDADRWVHAGCVADLPVTKSSPGPTGGKFTEEGNIEDVADPVGIDWGKEKPDRPGGYQKTF
jgi:hypothetical protein